MLTWQSRLLMRSGAYRCASLTVRDSRGDLSNGSVGTGLAARERFPTWSVLASARPFACIAGCCSRLYSQTARTSFSNTCECVSQLGHGSPSQALAGLAYQFRFARTGHGHYSQWASSLDRPVLITWTVSWVSLCSQSKDPVMICLSVPAAAWGL